ncbi:MAG: hypothetical protein ACKV2U_32475 [Bryobacteraceae bacterium]
MSERRNYFTYSAAGSAIGGLLTSPKPLRVPTQAMASLSPSGGYACSTVENFGIDGLLTMRRGTTAVEGDARQTEVTVTVEDVKIMNLLTVDLIVLRLVSHSVLGSTEASITPAGSVIKGLRYKDTEIPVTCSSDVFDRFPTFSALGQTYQPYQNYKGRDRDYPLRGLIMDPERPGEPGMADTLSGLESRIGDVKATLCPLDDECGGFPVVNGGIRLNNFGTLYLGEYRISKFARRLTMLRVELGCGTSGSLSSADGSGNGHWEPPN